MEHVPMTRRSFAALAGAAAVAPLAHRAAAAHTADRSGTRNPVLGEGEHTYECVHDWLSPPKGLSFGDTHGLTQDKAGRIYLAHTVHAHARADRALKGAEPFKGAGFAGLFQAVIEAMQNGLRHCRAYHPIRDRVQSRFIVLLTPPG